MERLGEPHHVQARLAFGGASDHGRAFGLVVAVEEDLVTIRFPLRAGTRRYQVDCASRLRDALDREDLLRLGGRPVAIVSDTYHALQLPHGTPADATRLAARYGIVVPGNEPPAEAGRPAGVVFNVRPADAPASRPPRSRAP